jgi:hypothetical protein
MSPRRCLLLAVLMVLYGVRVAPAQQACDRACLGTLLDRYLAAVVKHDPKAAPLIVGFRQTETQSMWLRAVACGRR